MTSIQESRLSTARAILKLFYDNESKWIGNKLIAESVKQLENYVNEIERNHILQQTPISGFAGDKKKYRDLVDNTTNILFTMYRAYGKKTGSETIYKQFNISLSKIQKIQDNEMPSTITIAKKFGEDNKDNLVDFGYTEKLALQYGKEEQGYINYLSKPIEGMAIRAAATEKLEELFSEMSAFLKEELDNEMIQYKITEPEFYKQYKKVRNIYDNPSHKTSLLGYIDNEDTGKREPGVTVTATCKSDTSIEAVVKTSGKTGYYGFPKLEPAIWIITYEKFNFDTITIELEIIKGKTTRRNVKIRPKE